MYDERTDSCAVARTSNLNEELGQVDSFFRRFYIFLFLAVVEKLSSAIFVQKLLEIRPYGL